MYKITRYKKEQMERALIQKYIDNNNDNDYLRYLIDTIYDDAVFICETCDNGIVLEVLQGYYSYGKCDACGKKYRYF